MTKNKAAIAPKRYAAAKRASQKAAIADSYLTVKSAAEMLKMSVSHVYFLKHQKRIPYLKLGGKLLFEREALKKWVDSNFQPPLPFDRKPRKKREKYYEITTGQMVDAPKTEVTYEGAKRFVDSLLEQTNAIIEKTTPKPDKAREVKKIVSKAREIRKPGEVWQDAVKRATLELKNDNRQAPMSNQEFVKMAEKLATPDLNTVLELGYLQIQILRSGKEISIIPDMDGDAIDLSAGICSLMMKNPEYRKIFETGVYMYQRFQKP